MRMLALVRNVNQGQRGHPSTDDLLAAFAAAGLEAAVAYRSNGTVVFDQPTARDPSDDIGLALAARTGLERAVFTIALNELAAIVASESDPLEMARREFTLHGGLIDIQDADAIAVAAHRRCRFLVSGPGWVITANQRGQESNATPVIERLIRGPATSRGLATMIAVAQRFALR